MRPHSFPHLKTRNLLFFHQASSLILFEGAVVAIIKQQGGDYGLQRLFGTFGAIIFGPIAGSCYNSLKIKYR